MHLWPTPHCARSFDRASCGVMALLGNNNQLARMLTLNRIAGSTVAALAAALLPAPALAEKPAKAAHQLQFKPILDARLRGESVDQGPLHAEAVTLRIRAGGEARLGQISFLAEVEGTISAVEDFNGFPFALVDDQWRPQHAVIADPRNFELNRLQLQYQIKDVAVTAGRQRINLDDQRWVGSVGWRQNEQTFDALAAEAKVGAVRANLAYAISQRSIFGEDAGSRAAIRGHFLFAGAGSTFGPIEGKLFAYLLDYEENFALPNSSQTYGGILSGSFPLGRDINLSLRGSYAHQSDYGDNPFDYSTDYWSFEGSSQIAGFDIAAGWEKLGSDNDRALQTPMATLHKFNGWADLFLTTPAAGLEDAYVMVRKTFDRVKALPGLNAQIAFHQFDSADGDMEYGTEWDASAGFKFGRLGLLVKYANYDAKDFGFDTRKLWLQAEWAL